MSVQVLFGISWAVAGLAGVLLFWALAWDLVRHLRKRPRRCPKCWYDLSHTPGLRCSECGYTAPREKKLFKSKKRWRYVVLSALLIVGVIVLQGVRKDVRQRGWIAAVPTTVLIAAMPWMEHDVDNPFWWGPPTRTPPLAVRMSNELTDQRMLTGSMSSWQERRLLKRCIRGDSGRPPASDSWFEFYGRILDDYVKRYPMRHADLIAEARSIYGAEFIYRNQWPRDAPFYVVADVRMWDSERSWQVVYENAETGNLLDRVGDSTSNYPAGATVSFSKTGTGSGFSPAGCELPRMSDPLRVNVHLEIRDEDDFYSFTRIASFSDAIEVDFVDSWDEIIEPVPIPALESAVERMADKVSLWNPFQRVLSRADATIPHRRKRGGMQVEFSVRSIRIPSAGLELQGAAPKVIALPFVIDVCQNGEQVGHGTKIAHLALDDDGYYIGASERYFYDSSWSGRFQMANIDASAPFTVRITSDRYLALLVPDAHYYWEGEIEFECVNFEEW